MPRKQVAQSRARRARFCGCRQRVCAETLPLASPRAAPHHVAEGLMTPDALGGGVTIHPDSFFFSTRTSPNFVLTAAGSVDVLDVSILKTRRWKLEVHTLELIVT